MESCWVGHGSPDLSILLRCVTVGIVARFFRADCGNHSRDLGSCETHRIGRHGLLHRRIHEKRRRRKTPTFFVHHQRPQAKTRLNAHVQASLRQLADGVEVAVAESCSVCRPVNNHGYAAMPKPAVCLDKGGGNGIAEASSAQENALLRLTDSHCERRLVDNF